MFNYIKTILRRLIFSVNNYVNPPNNLPLQFYPRYDLLASDAPIIPAVRFTRGWIAGHKKAFKASVKTGPLVSNAHALSTHRCPALVTLFSSGYIVPAHRDFCIHTSGDIENPTVLEGSSVGIPDPNSDLSHGSIISSAPFGPHMLGGIHRPYPERTPNMIFKLEPVWSVWAPRDITLLILGVPFADNYDFTIVPGFLDTQLNPLIQPLLWWHHHDRRDVYIKKGTPLLQLIPISRSDLKRGMEIVTDPKLRREERRLFEELLYLRESQFVMNYGRLRKSVDAYQAQREEHGQSPNLDDPLNQSKSKCPFSFLWSK